MKKFKTQVNPLEGSILKNMILFAIPIMLTNFLQVLFSSVDTMIIGKFGKENGMSAIGASATLIHLIISVVTGLSAGISMLVGKYYGKKDFKSISNIIRALPFTGLIIGTIVALIANIFSKPLLKLVNCSDILMDHASIYFRIYFLSLPFMLIFSFLSAIMQSKGDSTKPVLIQIVCGVVNLILNLIFVIYFNLDIAGVAIATVISQVVSAILIMYHFVKEDEEIKLDLKKLVAFKGMKEVFKLGIPSSIEGVLMNLSGVVVSSAINGFEPDVIAGNTAASSIEGLMSIAFVGFSTGTLVFISQNYGKKQWEGVKKIRRICLSTVFILGEALGILILLLSPLLLKLYTDSPTIASYATTRMIYMCLFFGLCGAMNVASGSVRGFGEARIPLVISLITSCCFRILWILTIAKMIGTISSIYVSYPICWLLTTLLYYFAFNILLKKKIVLSNEELLIESKN